MDYKCSQAIILSAGISNKMKTYEPRSLLKIGDMFLFEKQYASISRALPSTKISIVCGYKKERVLKKVSGCQLNLSIFINDKFEASGPTYSLFCALDKSKEDVFFMHGDILFDYRLLETSYTESFIIFDSDGQLKDSEVGIVESNGIVSNFSYGLKTKKKWCQMAFLTGLEFELLKKLSLSEKYKYMLTFETLNEIIRLGGVIKCIPSNGLFISEIDSIKEAKNVKNIDC